MLYNYRQANNDITPNYSKDFWYVVDYLDDSQLINYSEKLLKLRKTQGQTYLQLCNIIHDYKTYKQPLTKKQKRYLAMTLITHWDEISIHFLY